MKLHFDDNKNPVTIGVVAFIVVAASIFFYYALFRGRNIVIGFRKITTVLRPVIYGAGIAFILTPVARFLEISVVERAIIQLKLVPSKTTRRLIRWICVFIALTFFIVIIYGLIATVLPEVFRSVRDLISNFPTYKEVLKRLLQTGIDQGFFVEQFTEMQEQLDTVSNMGMDYLTTHVLTLEFPDSLLDSSGMLLNITSGVVDILTYIRDFLIGCLISVYVMADRDKFVAKAKMAAYAVLPRRWARIMISGMRYTGGTFSGFISGKLIDSVIIGMICYVGCTIMEMPYSILVSVVIGATNVIPFFGPFLGAIPCTFLILLVDPWKGLYFLIFILVLQQFDGNILGPKILGDSTGLSSLMVIVAIMIGGGFFGFPGMVIGVPAFAVFYNGLELLTQRKLRSKKLSDVEEYYMNIDCLADESGVSIPFTEESTGIITKKAPKPKRRSALSRAFMKVWDTVVLIVVSVLRIVFMGLRYIFNRIHVWFINTFRGPDSQNKRDR